MIQFPTYYVDSLVKSGIDFDSVAGAIFRSALSDEELEEIELVSFVLDAELELYLNPDQSYDVYLYDDLRNQ